MKKTCFNITQFLRKNDAKIISFSAILNKKTTGMPTHYRLSDGRIAEEWIEFGTPILYVFSPGEVKKRHNTPLRREL